MDCIILAGGKGSRMEDSLPKALVQVKEKPILSYQIEYLSNKIDKIILALGFKAQQIIDYVQKNYPDKNIEFSVEDKKLGTGGAIKKALALVSSPKVLVLNCDDITNINIKELEQLRENTICVAHPQLPFGLVKEKNGYAVFTEKPTLSDWTSCGWYLFNKKKIINLLPDVGNIETEVFPYIKLKLYKHQGFWRSFNTKKDIEEFEKENLPKIFQ